MLLTLSFFTDQTMDYPLKIL